MKKTLIYTLTIFGFFIIGVVIANFIIMPLIVRKGREIAVPNVCNMPLDSALIELRRKNLEGVVTERRFDMIIQEGNIIVQEPLPDSRVKEGRIINLTVSLGPEIIKVPFLAGVHIDKAKLIVRRLGFILQSIEYVHSDSIPMDKVMHTIPDADVDLHKGDSIQLIVSKGPVLKMPNLTGMKIDEARIIIDKNGLVLGEIKEVEGSGDKGSIIVQDPAPDQVVDQGDTVTVMVIK